MSWLLIIAIGVGTYALRASFLLALKGRAPPGFESVLKYVPAAVLPALALSAITSSPSDVDLRFVAAFVAVGIAWWTRSVAAVMASGMLLLWALQWMM